MGVRDKRTHRRGQDGTHDGPAGRPAGHAHGPPPPHGSTPRPSAWRGGQRGKIPPLQNFLEKVNERTHYQSLVYSNGLFGIHNGGLCIAGFTQGTIRAVNGYYSRRYPLTIHNLAVLVTKCSEISLLYDKPLSTTKPRLYITSRLQLLCKSYALGGTYLDLSLPFSSIEPWYFLDQFSASLGLVNDG